MDRLRSLLREIHRRSLWQVLGVYLVASWGALEAVQGITAVAGLPDWLPGLALALLVVGLPVVLATAFLQEGIPARERFRPAKVEGLEALQGGPGAGEATPAAAHRLFTWRNALLGGVGAFALWGLVATGLLLTADRRDPATADQGGRPSLAILPFDNLSPDEENAYFAAGIHEEILTQLSKVGGIKLISRTSVLRYENSEKSLSEIAGELGVSTVLEGSVQRAGDRVRITTQLIDAASDEHLWAERYDRDLSDIFAIQTDVATRIVEELRGVLTPKERAELARIPTRSQEAYAHYLRGHQHSRRLWSEEETRAAVEAYERAVALDPDFAAAWGHLVRRRLWLAWNYGERDERVRAREALERVEAVAPGSPEARWARGVWLYYGEQRYEDALREFDALADLRPGDVDAMGYRAALYRRLGRWDDAVRTMERVHELDPADASHAATIAQTYLMLRRFDEAERYAEMAVTLDPGITTHWNFLYFTRLSAGDTAAVRVTLDSMARHAEPETVAFGRAVLAGFSGRPEEALRIFLDSPARGFDAPGWVLWAATASREQDVIRPYADTLRVRAERSLERIGEENPAPRSGALATLALAHAHLGNREEALRLAEEAVEMLPVSHDAFYGPRRLRTQAEVYTLAGRHDEAVERLRYLLSIPAELVTVPLLRIDPRWAPLREHPGFRGLIGADG